MRGNETSRLRLTSGSVDGGNHDFAALVDRGSRDPAIIAIVLHVSRVVRLLSETGFLVVRGEIANVEVGTSAKGLALAGDDDHADRVVGVDGAVDFVHFDGHQFGPIGIGTGVPMRLGRPQLKGNKMSLN